MYIVPTRLKSLDGRKLVFVIALIDGNLKYIYINKDIFITAIVNRKLLKYKITINIILLFIYILS